MDKNSPKNFLDVNKPKINVLCQSYTNGFNN